MSSSTSGGGGYSKSTPSPYQSQLYDSWKTEWNAPAYHYDHYRTGPSGGSSGDEDRHQRAPSASYMTKGGRRQSYDDDF